METYLAYINVAIFGDESGSVLRMDVAGRPLGVRGQGGCLCTD